MLFAALEALFDGKVWLVKTCVQLLKPLGYRLDTRRKGETVCPNIPFLSVQLQPFDIAHAERSCV